MRDENLVLKAQNSELQARLTLMEKKKSKKKGGASRHRVGGHGCRGGAAECPGDADTEISDDN